MKTIQSSHNDPHRPAGSHRLSQAAVSLRKCIALLTAGLSTLIASHSDAATPLEQVQMVEHWDTTGNLSPVVHASLNFIAHQSPLASAQVGANEYIFYTYITPAGNIAVRRVVENNLSYTGSQTKTEYLLQDSGGVNVVVANDASHVGPGIGIDEDGYLHVAGNMHHHSWQYWVSNNPRDVSGGFTFKGMPRTTPLGDPNTDANGKFISPPGYKITYPYFANDRNGRLYVSFRHTVAKDVDGVAPYKGLMGGGIAQYDKSLKRWKMIGGVDYTLPVESIPITGAGNLRATFYQKVGANTATPWYQTYNIHFWFDPNNVMRVAAELHTDPIEVQSSAGTPDKVVYAEGALDGTDAEGFMKWKFLTTAAGDATWLSGDHTLSLPNNGNLNDNLHTVFTRLPGGTIGVPSNVGVVKATGGLVRSIVEFTHRRPEWTGSVAWWDYRDYSPAWDWYKASPTLDANNVITYYNLPPHNIQFVSQGIWGRFFLTSFWAWEGGTGGGQVWRSNDNGVSKKTYLRTGLVTSDLRLDARFNNAYTQNATVEKSRHVAIDINNNARIYTLQISAGNLLGDGPMTTAPTGTNYWYWSPWTSAATFSATGGSGVAPGSSCYNLAGGATLAGTENLRVEPGAIMNVSVWAKASTATGAKLRVLFYLRNSAGAVITTSGASTTVNAFPGDRVPTSTAQTFTATMTIPTTAGSPAQAPYYISALIQNVSLAPAPTITVDDLVVGFQ